MHGPLLRMTVPRRKRTLSQCPYSTVECGLTPIMRRSTQYITRRRQYITHQPKPERRFDHGRCTLLTRAASAPRRPRYLLPLTTAGRRPRMRLTRRTVLATLATLATGAFLAALA